MNSTAKGCLTLATLSAVASLIVFWIVVGGPMLRVVRTNHALIEWHDDVSAHGYVPPADDRLTQAQVDRLLRVALATESALSSSLEVLEADARWALGGLSPMAPGTGYFEREGRAQSTADQMLAARAAQVAAMNAQQMSVEELTWLNERVLLALFGTREMALLFDALKRGVGWPPAMTPNPIHPDAGLLLPVADTLERWMRIVGVLEGTVWMLDRRPIPDPAVGRAPVPVR